MLPLIMALCCMSCSNNKNDEPENTGETQKLLLR